jgi:hypothetical protein
MVIRAQPIKPQHPVMMNLPLQQKHSPIFGLQQIVMSCKS